MNSISSRDFISQKLKGMSDFFEFEDKSATEPAGHPVDLDGENTVSEEDRDVEEDVRSKNTSKESESWNLESSLTQKELDLLIIGYMIPESMGARLARVGEMAKSPAMGCVAVFDCQFRFGLRFPIFKRLREIIENYCVSIA